MRKIAANDCGGKVSQMADEAYSESPLPNFHPWLVRNGVKVAVYTLPYRSDFFKIAAPELTESEIIGFLERACVAMENIFNRSNEMYEKADLLNLP